jgi:hypothetical protein
VTGGAVGGAVHQWRKSTSGDLRDTDRAAVLAAQPKLVTPVLQVVHRVITRHLLGQAGLKAEQAIAAGVTRRARGRPPDLAAVDVDAAVECSSSVQPDVISVDDDGRP